MLSRRVCGVKCRTGTYIRRPVFFFAAIGFCSLFAFFAVTAGFAQSEDKQLFQEAESRFRARDYEFALEFYGSLIDDFPLSGYVPDAQFRRAVCLFRLDRSSEALELFKLVERRFPSSRFIAFVPFWIGVIEYNNKNYKEAAYYLRNYLEQEESSLVGQAKLTLAVSENTLGNVDAAIELLEDMLKGPVDADVYANILLNSLYIKQGRYTDVLDLVGGTDLSSVSDDQAWRLGLYEAEAYWHLERREEAVALYDQLLDAPPEISSVAFQRLFIYHDQTGNENALQNVVNTAEVRLAGFPEVLSEFWLRIGIESFREGKKDLAQSYFQRIWNMGNRADISGLVPLYLADILFEDGQKQQAIDILRSFLAVSYDQSEFIISRLAGFYLETGDWENAATYYSEFLSNFSESDYYSEMSYLLAYSLFMMERDTEALDVVGEVLQSARGGAFIVQLLRLQSILYKRTGDTVAAIGALQEYLPRNPEDAKARMDLIKLYFQRKEYENVISEVGKVKDVEPFSTAASSYFLLSRYMYGLAFISQKRYEEAAAILSEISHTSVEDTDLSIIYPYVLFYRGWAYYRISDYERAEVQFEELIREYPLHELQPRSAYLAGWCAFATGAYDRAEAHFIMLSQDADEATRIKTSFMLAKSLDSQGKSEEAAILFEDIYLNNPQSDIADDALFEYAGVLASLGQTEQSVASYKRLFIELSDSTLAEEAMYKRGELFFDRERYDDSREAFYEYRIEFPKGKLIDAALYWGGMASFEAGEAFGAVLLWEKLVENYRESAFRADALRRTAEIYEESGDFRKALNYYGELISVYPEEAKAIDAERKAEVLRYLILGEGEREAELLAVIDEEGSASSEGREAMLELARIYIYKSGSKQNQAPALLDDLIAKQADDPSVAARAQYYYGEYYYRKNDLKRAANEFLKTATVNPEDRDLVAQAMYRAAEMTKLAGNISEARALVDKLEELFPSSQWVESGRKLLEEER